MKVKNGFNLREVCGEHIIVAEGDENIDFSNIISMNESSAYLWEEVQKMDSFTVDNLVELICSQYEIDEDTARKDATILAAQWGTAGIIEGEDIPTDDSAIRRKQSLRKLILHTSRQLQVKKSLKRKVSLSVSLVKEQDKTNYT